MDVSDVFLNAVKTKIQRFNKTRGRRKALNPRIVKNIPLPSKNYGRTLKCGDSLEISPEAISKMAEATIRTLLKLKPRPPIIKLDVFSYERGRKYLFRLRLPKNRN